MPREEASASAPPMERAWLLSGLVRMNRYLLLLLLIPAGLIYFWPGHEWKIQAQKRQALTELMTLRDAKVASKKSLESKRDLIKNDSEYLEVVARDKLGMQKDGEYVLHFKD